MIRLSRLAASLCVLAPAAASGQLAGSMLGLQVHYPTMGDLIEDYGTRVVGPGVEWEPLRGAEQVDVFDAGFTYSSFSGSAIDSPFNGIRLYDPGVFTRAFARAYIVGASGVPMDEWRVTFDADNIYLNVAGLPGPASGPYSITVAVTTVPEPSTLALLGSGLAGLGLAGMKRMRAKRAE